MHAELVGCAGMRPGFGSGERWWSPCSIREDGEHLLLIGCRTCVTRTVTEGSHDHLILQSCRLVLQSTGTTPLLIAS